MVAGLGNVVPASAVLTPRDTSSSSKAHVGSERFLLPAEGRSKDGRATNETLYDAEGDRIGHVKLKPAGDGETRVQARITSAAPGFHGFHVHTTGVCDPNAPNGPFTTAGGHFALDGQSHGAHAGDRPSLRVMEDGTARLELVTDCFELNDLHDGDGSAVMVHAGRDNFANIPERLSRRPRGSRARTRKPSPPVTPDPGTRAERSRSRTDKSPRQKGAERRRRDLNPRMLAHHTISSRADSAALARLRAGV
jgi:Cu/Zn superoxide dismutase